MNKKMNILMATMGMNIGGAETHILELSKALAAAGHQITVVSNGGVFVPELLNANVQHITLPLHRRSVTSLLFSYLKLRRLIRHGGFDLVHAHARIPSFLCGRICKGRKWPPFVTTAHFTFQTGGIAGKLTNWGERTLAVSEDIRSYLTENYAIAEENIAVTVNGIDMERFSPKVCGAAVREELGIAPEAPMLLHVSRLDASPCMVAERLIELAPSLHAQHPKLHIVIIGGGDQFARLKEAAEKQNKTLGQSIITLTGGRTDIANCIAASDVFVGVSRAALEAMSMQKPLVLAGHQGYAGIFGEDKLALSRETNFCFRGEALPTCETMLGDILFCLAADAKTRLMLGTYGREIVAEYYSVTKMAQDALAMYEAVGRPTKILISGYYGFKNAGDEAILYAFVKSMQESSFQTEITALSNTPLETEQKHGCNAVHRFRILSVLRAIRATDIFVSGGGSLLQDKSSTRSIIYYLSLIRLAKWMKKPVMLYANGIGPVIKPANRKRVRESLKQADLITLREESSRDELIEIGICGEKIHVTADPIFLLDLEEKSEPCILTQADIPTDAPIVGISVRTLRTEAGFVEKMAKLADRLTKECGYRVVFLPMQTPHDVTFSHAIMEKMTEKAYLLDPEFAPEAFIGAYRKMEVVLSMRLHTMLFAAKANTPIVGIICDPKIEYFLEKLAQESVGDVEQFDEARTFVKLQEVISEKAWHKATLANAVDEMNARAIENTKLLEQMIKAGKDECKN